MQSGLFIFWNLSFWFFHRTYNQEGKNFSSFREPDGSLTDEEVLWRPSPPQLPYLEQSGGAEAPAQPYLGRKLAAKPTDTTGWIRNPSQWDYHFSLPNYRMDGSGEPYRASDRSWEKPDCQYKVFAAETFSCLVVLPKKRFIWWRQLDRWRNSSCEEEHWCCSVHHDWLFSQLHGNGWRGKQARGGQCLENGRPERHRLRQLCKTRTSNAL